MKLLTAVLTVLFGIQTRCSFAQPDSCSFSLPVNQLYAGRLGTIYILNPEGIFSFDFSCRPLNSFTLKIAGGIQSVDVSNPLKILAFSKTRQSIYVLDDNLHQQSVVDLKEAGILQPVAVCNSRHDGFRVFDQATRRLYRFTFNLFKENETEILVPGISHFDPVMMIETEKNLYISNPPYGIHVFDRYAGYLKTIEGNASGIFAADENSISFLRDSAIVRITNTGMTETVKPSDAKTGFNVHNKIYEAFESGFRVSGR